MERTWKELQRHETMNLHKRKRKRTTISLHSRAHKKMRNLSTNNDRQHQDRGADKNLQVGSGSK
jgi:hypothetical protein